MRRDLFHYHLPPELIAQEPLPDRTASRLLVVDCEGKTWEHRRFPDLVEYLRPGDVLVFNRTRVRKARLRGRKRESGGKVEILLLEEKGEGTWEALARPARRLPEGTVVLFGESGLEAEIVARLGEGRVLVRFPGLEEVQLEEFLEREGEVPLPPYIRKGLEDPERYQTVYAQETGSAAAPTAGLHFDWILLERIRSKGVRTAFLRLDVGIDTFRPIGEEDVERHRIHREWISVEEEVCREVNEARRRGGRVIAVGTTTVRALETAAARSRRMLEPFSGYTDLYIYPPFHFRVVDGIVTNFHLPESSLLVMVCAFAGRKLVLSAYEEAVRMRYRFLSFGDATLFLYPNGWKEPGDD
jgi:S-adenosylmethionine:tRNA ribosyltransferase-isomerase